MQQKKRAHDDDESPVVSKKRNVSSGSSTPQTNGVVSQPAEPGEGDNLELFRKEAIYRRMRHYAREYARSQARVNALEARKNSCEAGITVITACWTQLSETIRALVDPNSQPSVDVGTRRVLDLASQITNSESESADIGLALEDSMKATKDLIVQLVQRGVTTQPSTEAQWQQEHVALQAEIKQVETRLTSEVELLKFRLQDMETANADLNNQLVSASIRADRASSATVQAIEKRMNVKTEGVEEPQSAKPPSPSADKAPSMDEENEGNTSLLQVIQIRGEQMARVSKEAEALRAEIAQLKLDVQQISAEKLAQNPSYIAIQDELKQREASVTEARESRAATEEENKKLKELSKAMNAEHELKSQQILEFKTLLDKRDAENARIRETRDQQAADLHDRKYKDSIKMASHQEQRTLAESRLTRIAALESEVRRCKSQLAAQAGNVELMTFLFRSDEDPTAYIEQLKGQLAAAEARASAAEQSFSYFRDHPDAISVIRADAETKAKLEEVTAQLEKYQAVYGDASMLPPEIQKLSDLLQQKEAEIVRLRALEAHHQESEAPLYSEIEKLSLAWESLDKQVASKVFDLSSLEERIVKNVAERAKMENKFYAVVRAKESLEGENKNLLRHREKQKVAIQRTVDAKMAAESYFTNLEYEVEQKQLELENLRTKVSELEVAYGTAKANYEHEKHRVEEAWRLQRLHESQVTQQLRDLHTAEEAAWKSHKEAEKLKDSYQKAKSAASAPVSQKTEALQQDLDQVTNLVQCKVCSKALRDTIITKCMHTFCRSCIDMRLSSRQRKCPSCGQGFGHQDVSNFFLQG
ncbi:hypothetical protein HGRIS_002557 [Hohenbuehelia grisea]|uniref:E3 ubiquitin protein ligase n=1 Tax=Hohenbuehelia grisea TaxID=104357 RepID=A0ABR3JLD0_9AGAR